MLTIHNILCIIVLIKQLEIFKMRIDAKVIKTDNRICISIEDFLYDAFADYMRLNKTEFPTSAKYLFTKKIMEGEIENSNDAKLFIFSCMMKPSAYQCFSKSFSNQMDIEDF